MRQDDRALIKSQEGYTQSCDSFIEQRIIRDKKIRDEIKKLCVKGYMNENIDYKQQCFEDILRKFDVGSINKMFVNEEATDVPF